jgi:DNA polymerase III subunit delta
MAKATPSQSFRVLLVVGADPLLCDREVERRLISLQSDGVPTLIQRLDAAELDELPELRTASLLGERTVVVLRGVEALSGEANRPLREQLETYLAAPDPLNVLVLIARSVGRIPTLAKAAAAAGEKLEVALPAEHDAKAWERQVADEFARLGRQAEPAAVVALLSHAGHDATVIASQVATVAHTAEPGRAITVADVEDVVAGQGRTSAFAIADAIEQRDPSAALLALRGAMGSGEAPLRIVGALTFRFRQLLQARAGADARDIGIPPGRLTHLRRSAQAFLPGELAWCHDRLARLDLELKGSDLPDDVLMDVAVLELATSRAPGAPFDPTAQRPSA